MTTLATAKETRIDGPCGMFAVIAPKGAKFGVGVHNIPSRTPTVTSTFNSYRNAELFAQSMFRNFDFPALVTTPAVDMECRREIGCTCPACGRTCLKGDERGLTSGCEHCNYSFVE